MITLCPRTFELAKRMDNFSEWVRDQLKNSDTLGNLYPETHLHLCPLGCQKVTDYKNSPTCPQHGARMKLVPSKQLKLVE